MDQKRGRRLGYSAKHGAVVAAALKVCPETQLSSVGWPVRFTVNAAGHMIPALDGRSLNIDFLPMKSPASKHCTTCCGRVSFLSHDSNFLRYLAAAVVVGKCGIPRYFGEIPLKNACQRWTTETPFRSITTDNGNEFADQINAMPRIRLGCQTPEELFEQQLDKSTL